MIVADAMAWFNNYGVTSDGTAAAVVGGGEVLASLDAAITSPTANSLRDILHKDGSHTYSKTTDSLEALSEAIAAIASPTDVTAAVGTTPTARSLQDILEKDTSGNFDDSTDSLEAIADALAAGTGCTTAIEADLLHKLISAADGGSNVYPDSVVQESILAFLMSKSANPVTTSYDNTTDSLEAISDAISAITDNVTAAVSATPTARSLQDILEKDGSSGFDDSTDSLEAIADRLIDANIDKLTSAADGTGNYPASVVQDSVVAMILSKSANPVASSYDNQTDSLEAISDALSAAIGSPSAGSALDILKKLYYTSDGTGAYPATLANDSTLAKIMCKGSTATPSTFDNTTDSLEAIADSILSGTGVLSGIQLDHLQQTDTGVAADGDLTTHVADGSVIAHILSATKDTSTYKCTTDSLEAISDALAAGTGCTTALDADQLDHLLGTDTGVAIDGDLETYCVAGSVMAHVLSASKDATDYKCSTDSLQAISDFVRTGTSLGAGIQLDHLQATDTGVAIDGDLETFAVAGSLMAHIMSVSKDVTTYKCSTDSLEAIGTDTDAIITDLTYQEQCVEKVATSTDDDLFDVTGEVLITSLVGIVTTTAIGAVQNRIKIGLDATNLYDFDFTTEVDTNGDAVGTRYVFSAANPAVLTPLSNGAAGSGNPQYPWVCPAGVIEQFKNGGDAGTTGQINWYLTYKPLSSDGSVSAAA